MAKYDVTWRPGCNFSQQQDVKKVFAELERIKAGSDDKKLHAANIVAAAKAADSILHGFFEWDNRKAADQYRLDQASMLIRSIVIVRRDHEQKGTTRAYTVEPGAYARGQGRRPYDRTEDMLRDPELRSQILQRALGELMAFQRKYRALQELAIVMRAVDELMTTIK